MQGSKNQRIQEEINEDNIGLVVFVPKSAVSMEITIDFIDDEDGELHQAFHKYSPEEFRECRRDYLTLDPYENAFATYALTDEGQELLRLLEDE